MFNIFSKLFKSTSCMARNSTIVDKLNLIIETKYAVLTQFTDKFEYLSSKRSRSDVKDLIRNYGSIEEPNERKICQHLHHVIGDDRLTESVVDDFLHCLLSQIGFDTYPCVIRIKYPLFEPNSRPDLIVAHNQTIRICVENKRYSVKRERKLNAVTAERQLIVQMIGGAKVNDDENHNHDSMRAIRVIGTYFTFYESLISRQYLNDLIIDSKGNIEQSSQQLIVYRTSPDHSIGFDFLDADQRKCIIDYLYYLRKLLQN